MPRQLPWLDSGGGGSSRSAANNKPKGAIKPRIPDNIDDDFFEGTVLGRKDKGKRRTDLSSDSEDDAKARKERLPSSSPPPIQDHIQPEIEYMRKGTKYDLRDDEWMMVEDEFLETAKLFTRHLHIAEYEKLKEQIQAKKKEQVEAVRPTVAGAKFSTEGGMKKRAKLQEKKQQKAIRDVFASQDSSAEEVAKIPTRALHSSRQDSDNDSDNLDAPLRHKRPPVKTSTSNITSSLDAPRAATTTSSTFMKPSAPASTTQGRPVPTRKSRATPFDMLDDYLPPAKRISDTSRVSASPARTTAISRSPSDPTTTSKTQSVTYKDDDDWGRNRRESSTMSKETADRIARRRAEREKEKEGEKDIKLDDIPTFLF